MTTKLKVGIVSIHFDTGIYRAIALTNTNSIHR